MISCFRAQDEPETTRVDYWQHVMASTLVPYRIRTVGCNLRSEIHQADIGPVTVLGFQSSAMENSRTPDLIRNSDRGLCNIYHAMRGRGVFEQDGREAMPVPGEFHLVDLGRPHHVAIDRWIDGAIVMFPRALLPVREKELRRLTLARFSPHDPYGGLVSSLVRELVRHLDAYESVRDSRIGMAFLDLLSVAMATRLDRVSGVPAESRQNAMLLRIQSFIGHHLGDPGLSPGMIAAAHNISIRTLHRLYEAEDETIVASIRRRRLQRCRQDLLDPRLGNSPVSAVGARWGFQDPAAFSRAFRTAYGVPPGEYRAAQLGLACLAGPAGTPTGPGSEHQGQSAAGSLAG